MNLEEIIIKALSGAVVVNNSENIDKIKERDATKTGAYIYDAGPVISLFRRIQDRIEEIVSALVGIDIEDTHKNKNLM